MSRHLFLLGAQPDAIVLCVNPFDELDYIERTVKYIESVVISKVFAVVVFSMNIKNVWTGLCG